ncbi:MAG: hemolysin family protein [Phycisphaerales bacterium]
MQMWAVIGALVCAVLLLLVASLRNAVRDFSLRKLETLAKQNGGMGPLEPIVEHDDAIATSLGVWRSVFVGALFACAVLGVLDERAEGVLGFAGVWPVVWSCVLATVGVLVFGTVLPTAISNHAGERLIYAFPWLIKLLHALALPARPLVYVDEIVKRLAGAHTITEKDEVEDDVIAAAMEGERGGALGETEREMIENVIELGGTTTEEIMTPRTDIDGLEMTDDLGEVARFIGEVGHSRIPVYTDDLDHIEGILYAKDLLPMVGRDASGFRLKDHLREALFVHERKPVHELLLELQSKKVHLAIVLDEYGGTTGLVTLEDVMEEIVGEIQDEYETEEDAPPAIEVMESDRRAEMDARATVDDANDAMEAIGVELPESDDYETVGGYALALFGHFPEVGERAPSQDGTHELEVLEAEPTRILKVRVLGIQPHESESSDTVGIEGEDASVS